MHGLAEASKAIKVQELAFWDIDMERLKVIARVAEAMA